MQSPLEQRELDAIRYNTDGRCFRLEIEGEVLRLKAIYSSALIVERVAISVIGIVVLLEFLIPVRFTAEWLLETIFWIGLVGIPCLMFGLAQWPKSYHAVKWDFDRQRDILRLNKRDFVSLSEISRVVAFRRGKFRLLLALELKNGKQILIGKWYFSSKEFAWREDAQTIADFLNVPLQIPNVFD